MFAVAAMGAFFLAQTIVLDNGAIRIEADARLFHIRFAGFPGGTNFVEPLPIEEPMRGGVEWADPGGLVTDVWPSDERDAALRRGPATITSQDRLSTVLLGPVSPISGLRMKKEIRLDAAAPKMEYVVSLLASTQTSRRLAVRTMARLPLRTTLRLARDNAEVIPLAGTDKLAPAVVRSNDYWLIPIPPTSRMNKVVLGSTASSFSIENRSGVWTRTIHSPESPPQPGNQATPFFCIMDDETRSYGAALQSEPSEVSLGAPLVFAEDWVFEKHGGGGMKGEG